MDMLTRMKMAPRLYFFLIGSALASFYFFNFQDDGVRIDSEIKTATEQLAKATKDLEDTNRVIANKEQFQQEFQEVSEKFRAAVEYLPETFNVQELLKQIDDETRASGVNKISVKPKNPEPKDFYEELSIDIELEGPFTLLTTFLAYMSKQNRIVNIKNISIEYKQMVDGSPRLTMKGTLQSYRYRKQEVAPSVAPTPKKT